jgi:hypothetical protein
MARLDGGVVDDSHGFLDRRQHALGATTVVQFVAQGFFVGLFGGWAFSSGDMRETP